MNIIDKNTITVRKELLTQASMNIRLSSLGVLLNVIVLAVVFWDIQNQIALIIWFLSILAITLFRYYKTNLFFKDKHHVDIKQQENEFKKSTLMISTLLSIGIMLLFPNDKPLYQAFMTIIITGIAAGITMSLSTYYDLTRNYLIILMTPFIYITYTQNNEIHLFLSLMILLFLILLILFSKKYNENIINLIISKLKAEETKKELQHTKDNFSTIFEEATVGILTFDTDLIVQEANRALTDMLNVSHAQLKYLDLKTISDKRILPCLNSVIEDKKGFYEGPYHTKIAKKEIWISMETVPMYDIDTNISGGLGIVTDITQKVKSNEKIRYQAFYDHLTGLENRLAFNDKLQKHIMKLSKENSFSSVLFIDLDHFKNINDSLGHHIGDSILKTFAQRALSVLRTNDTISRLGGDEFVILLGGINRNEKAAIETSNRVADKLHQIMKIPINIEENLLHITLSIGINTISSKHKDIHDILKHADIAMYKAKDAGRNTTRIYEEKMGHHINEQLLLTNELRLALQEQQFELYYQPIVDMKSNNIISCEALIRWNHPQRGLIFPDGFIPYAEENNLIISIGDWVIDKACQEYKEFNSELKDIAINISSKQFIQEDFVDKIVQAVKRNQIEPSALKLELTESVAIDNLSNTVKKMNILKSHGFKIAMDDFGTGYSSLSYLKHLPFDFIKIDRSFVKDMLQNDGDASLVKTILAISKQYSFSVIAEGVETQQNIDVLKALDCDYYQGFVKSKPIPANKFKELYSSQAQ